MQFIVSVCMQPDQVPVVPFPWFWSSTGTLPYPCNSLQSLPSKWEMKCSFIGISVGYRMFHFIFFFFSSLLTFFQETL